MAASDRSGQSTGAALPGLAPAPPPVAPWSDRLRRSAVVLLVAALALVALVVLGGVPFARAIAVFVCIVGAALIPWQLHDAQQSRGEAIGAAPVETPVVRALIEGMPDPAVLLDRAGRVLHFNIAAGQLAPALRRNELAQFALRSPEIITALREAITYAQPRRTSYVDHRPG